MCSLFAIQTEFVDFMTFLDHVTYRFLVQLYVF
jgi:hypothetical protein